MLRLRLTLSSIRDAEQNSPDSLPEPLSDDEILRALCYSCKIQSTLPRDKITRLYERAQAITDCLVDYEVRDDYQVHSPEFESSDHSGLHANSSEPACINPSLLEMNVNAQDTCMTTFVQTRTLFNREDIVNQPPSLQHETVNETPADPRPLNPPDGHTPNEFDWALREYTDSNASNPSLSPTQESCDLTKESELSIPLSRGGYDHQETPGMDIDEGHSMPSASKTPSPACDRAEGINSGRSDGLVPHESPTGTIQECVDEMEVTEIEGDAHQDLADNNVNADHPASESLTYTPKPLPSLFYPTPDSNPPDTPTPTSRRAVRMAEAKVRERSPSIQSTNNIQSHQCPSKLHPMVEDAPDDTDSNAPYKSPTSDGNFREPDYESDCVAPNNIQNGQSLPKMQPTVEDAPDDTDYDTPDSSSADEDNFGDSDIESAIDEALGFLQGIPSGNEECPPSDENVMSLKPNRSTSGSTNSSINDLPELPCEESANRSTIFSGPEINQTLHLKRKFSSAIEPDSIQPSRNLRSLGKGRDGNEDYNDSTSEDAHSTSEDVREISTSEGISRCSTEDTVRSKTRAPYNSKEDKWEGRFSCHPGLSALPPGKKDDIERQCSRILRPDLPDFLGQHTKSWISSGFWRSPSLDVSRHAHYTPTNAKGFAIWRYVEAMQADEATYYLKSRLADIMLYLEYVGELDRQKEAGHPGQTAKIRATNIICGTGSLPKAVADKTRKSFHEHKLVGERWWWCGCYMGRGLFLLCSQETGKKIQSKSFPLDAFILYVLFNCQNLLAFCSKFDHLVNGLLVDGEFPKQLSKKEVQLWIRETKTGNQESISTACWQPWSTNAVASKASDFLSARSNGLEHTS